ADAIFVRPLVTEKSLGLARHDVYAFEVALRATKIEIKKAFANLYGIMPTGVRVARQQGKVVRFARREGRRRDSKKAFITVPKGTTIDI
ncbi:MAG: 50S ribosomal protein L23, partial [Patescibacteria group bacterium]